MGDGAQRSSGRGLVPSLAWVPELCIYHSPCSDGFGAYWSVYKKYGANIQYLEGNLSTRRNDARYWLNKVRNRRVVIFDFSFERALMERLYAAASHLALYDHHLSAQIDLEGLPYCYFDMDKSGAMLAWEAIFPKRPAPKLIHYVQDQDLGEFGWGYSHAIGAAINNTRRSIAQWDQLARRLEKEETFGEVVAEGETILKQQQLLLARTVFNAEVWRVWGRRVVTVNCPEVLRAAACETLQKLYPNEVVGAFEIKNGNATWSLRSAPGCTEAISTRRDVSLLAGSFAGGGGHKHSSGFTVPAHWMNFGRKTLRPQIRQIMWNVLIKLRPPKKKRHDKK